MEIDLTKPHSGRMLDYWLGGHHHFEVDRQMCLKVAEGMPGVAERARRVRRFLSRVVTYMIVNLGLDTFLDFGAGLPTCENTHIVAQRINPNVRVVYSDIDPLVVSYAQDILRNVSGVCYLQCDATYPDGVLQSPVTLGLIDDQRRVGIIYMNLAHFIKDGDLNRSMCTLWEWCAPGSYLFLSTITGEVWQHDEQRKKVMSLGESRGLITYRLTLPLAHPSHKLR